MAEPYASLRDAARLEAALARPENAAHYRGADIAEQAAVLAVAVSQAQAFVQGNKRTGYSCAIIFLRQNGRRFVGRPLEFARRLTAVAVPSVGTTAAETEFVQWSRPGEAVPRRVGVSHGQGRAPIRGPPNGVRRRQPVPNRGIPRAALPSSQAKVTSPCWGHPRPGLARW